MMHSPCILTSNRLETIEIMVDRTCSILSVLSRALRSMLFKGKTEKKNTLV